MRISKLFASTVLALVVGSGAALAAPFNPFGTAGGQVTTAEKSFESKVVNVGDTLNGIFRVTSIDDITGTTYTQHTPPQYVSGVFSGFKLAAVTNLNGQFQLYFTGGALNYYSQATDPWVGAAFDTLTKCPACTPAQIAAAQTAAMTSLASGTNLLSLTPQVITNAGPNHPILVPNTTLEIDITQGNLNNVQAASTQEVYLDITGGTLAGLFLPDTFLNSFTNLMTADAIYQGSAATNQCNLAAGQNVWPVCGTNHATLTKIPEPITLSLVGAGLVGAASLRRRKQNKA